MNKADISKLNEIFQKASNRNNVMVLSSSDLKPSIQLIYDLVAMEAERMEWSFRTFPEATAISSLRKLESEIKEIEATIVAGTKNPEEYADALMCLFDSAGRFGISPVDIFDAFEKKLAINKARTWTKNPDNSYSHVKAPIVNPEHLPAQPSPTHAYCYQCEWEMPIKWDKDGLPRCSDCGLLHSHDYCD